MHNMCAEGGKRVHILLTQGCHVHTLRSGSEQASLFQKIDGTRADAFY